MGGIFFFFSLPQSETLKSPLFYVSSWRPRPLPLLLSLSLSFFYEDATSLRLNIPCDSYTTSLPWKKKKKHSHADTLLSWWRRRVHNSRAAEKGRRPALLLARVSAVYDLVLCALFMERWVGEGGGLPGIP